jgi:hypothetical protein
VFPGLFHLLSEEGWISQFPKTTLSSRGEDLVCQIAPTVSEGGSKSGDPAINHVLCVFDWIGPVVGLKQVLFQASPGGLAQLQS